MNDFNTEYAKLLRHIINKGNKKTTRNGLTRSIFGHEVSHNMELGLPLLTSRKVHFHSVLVELLWFLKGRTDLKYLLDNNCTIWVGDAYKYYKQHQNSIYKDCVSVEEFIELVKNEDVTLPYRSNDLGLIYGRQWRGLYHTAKNPAYKIVGDQIKKIVELLKTDPDSRRMLVSAWKESDLEIMLLPPCHDSFQLYTFELDDLQKEIYGKERGISLIFRMRSTDVPLGLPFNMASYGILLELFAKVSNMQPIELKGYLGDAHIYENQLDGCETLLKRHDNTDIFPEYPKLNINAEYDDLGLYELTDFDLVGYEPLQHIKFPLSN